MPLSYQRSVIISRDGARGIEAIEYGGLRHIANRTATAACFKVRLAPKGEVTPIDVVFSDTFPAKPSAFGVPNWGFDGNLALFGEAAIGEYLDAPTERAFVPTGKPPFTINCLSPELKAWEDRETSEDDVILRYIAGKCWWSFRYSHSQVVLGAPDFLRLAASHADVLRLADLEHDHLWTIQRRSLGWLVLKPSRELIKSFRPGSNVSQGPNDLQPPRDQSFINLTRLDEIRSIESEKFDFRRLVRIAEELNVCYSKGCYFAVAALTRAMLDHVPPLFDAKSFLEVVNNYQGAKSFRDSMRNLEASARKIGDAHLHQRIRDREVLPNETQVNFSHSIDVLLQEIVRIYGVQRSVSLPRTEER